MPVEKGVKLDKPKYDQSTYWNRVRHFALLTNPLNLLATDDKLQKAKQTVQNYKAGKPVPECKTIDDVWRAKYLYDSAFHPETGEKSMIIGRMSAQVPMNTLITGCMMSFYKTTPAVVFWQWINQSFNAVVNYTNRSGTSTITQDQLMKSYIFATGGALTTALTLNRMVKRLHPIVGRLVPLAAVAAANCINVPMMRYQELKNGINVEDDTRKVYGASKKAAKIGITTVVLSRIAMALPGMVLTPILMENLAKRCILIKYPWSNAPIQTLFCGFVLLFATPLGLACFRQRAAIKVSKLEKELQDGIKKKNPKLDTVYYNKGL